MNKIIKERNPRYTVTLTVRNRLFLLVVASTAKRHRLWHAQLKYGRYFRLCVTLAISGSSSFLQQLSTIKNQLLDRVTACSISILLARNSLLKTLKYL